MPPKPKRVLALETTWIRGYARSYEPSEAGFLFCADDLRRAGVTLVVVRRVLSHGRVVFADKLDGPGAIWIVEGCDTDEEFFFRLTIKVVSAEHEVTLLEIERVELLSSVEKPRVATGGNRDTGNDAA